jgi:hypothetical protein
MIASFLEIVLSSATNNEYEVLSNDPAARRRFLM